MVDISSIELRSSRSVIISVIVLKGVRAQQASVQLELVDDERVIPVQMEIAHSSATRLWATASRGLEAAAPAAKRTWEDEHVSWELSWVGRGPEEPGGAAAGLRVDAALTGWSSRGLVLELAASQLAAVLGPGSAFTLRLRVQGGQYRGEAALDLNAGWGPSGGGCVSAPTAAAALTEHVVTICSEWAALHLPLQFRFGTEATWTPWSYLNWYSGVYPAGEHLLRAEVRDANGASTLSSATMVHVHESNGTSVLGGEREGRFEILKTAVEALRRLKRMPTLLHLSMLFMSTAGANEELQGKGTLASFQPSTEIAAFQEYRTRVRNLLLRVCASAAPDQTSQLTSTAVFEASTTLASQPDEVFDEKELAILVDSAAAHVLADQLRAGDMEEGLRALNSVIVVSEHLDQVRHVVAISSLGGFANS